MKNEISRRSVVALPDDRIARMFLLRIAAGRLNAGRFFRFIRSLWCNEAVRLVHRKTALPQNQPFPAQAGWR